MRHPHLIPLLVLPLAGCVTVSESNPTPPVIRATPREQPGAVAKVLVSALTRIGVDGSGDPVIFLHLDFRDAGEKSIKAFGQIRAELMQPGAIVGGTGTRAEPTLARTWDVDLRDSLRNALSFDEMITRTYTIKLSGVPDWLVSWAKHEGAAANEPAPTLNVQFLPPDATNVTQALRAKHTLTR